MHLLFDIGGTKTRLALWWGGRTPHGNPLVFNTPKRFEDGVETMVSEARRLQPKNWFFSPRLKAAVGGIAGTLNRQKDRLLMAPNLPGWADRPLADFLAQGWGVPVRLENDAALAGLGEAVHGAGRGFKIVAYITVSTGVGGARIVDGEIDETSLGFEIGHQIIDADRTMELSRAAGGDLESAISGRNLERFYGQKPSEISDRSVWDHLARLLAFGLNNTIVHWSPDVVVLGGSMMRSPGIAINDVVRHLTKIMKGYPELPVIKRAQLDDFGGLYGAMVLAHEQ